METGIYVLDIDKFQIYNENTARMYHSAYLNANYMQDTVSSRAFLSQVYC